MKRHVYESSEAEILAEIRRIFTQEMGRTSPVLTSHRLAADLQLDSVSLLTLVVGLENRFQVILDEGDTEGVSTVGDLVGLVARRRQEA